MRGEGVSVDWSELLVPTNIGWQPASETYVGEAWTGANGADLEKVLQGSEPPKPFMLKPDSLIEMLPRQYQLPVPEHDLTEDLKEFVLNALKVWTTPRILFFSSKRQKEVAPEFCLEGANWRIDASSLSNTYKELNLPIDGKVWTRYLKRLEDESRDYPIKRKLKYFLESFSCIEKIQNRKTEPEATARCIGRGWDKYYQNHETTHIRRHPDEDSGNHWKVSDFVIEQLRGTEWVPIRTWGTRLKDGKENSGEFTAVVKPSEAVKVSRDLFGPGSTAMYSLIPHIIPNVEPHLSEHLCGKLDMPIYSPRHMGTEVALDIMRLLYQAHGILPSEREHFLKSLWQDLLDMAVSESLPNLMAAKKPVAALGFEVKKDMRERPCWISSGEEKEKESQEAWINDNNDSFSLLPPGTIIIYTGKGTSRLDDRITLLEYVLDGIRIRRLSELKVVPECSSVDGWEDPKPLSDVFPWLFQPSLAVLAFGRDNAPPMSVSNPKGPFQSLVSRIQGAKVKYVNKLKIGLDGLDVETEPRAIYYYSSENLFLIDMDANLKLRDMAGPLSSIFERSDYLKPAQLWLMNIEEASERSSLREDVSLETAIGELRIDQTSLQELFQVIGGQTQQIIRSVAPALFVLVKKGRYPISPEEMTGVISGIADSSDTYDLAERVMAGILKESGVSKAAEYAGLLRQIVKETHEAAEISRKVYELIEINLEQWNSAAKEIGAKHQVLINKQGIDAFHREREEARWAACGFLQKHLSEERSEEFKNRWQSYDNLGPDESVNRTWSPSRDQVVSPISEWFLCQDNELLEQPILADKNSSELLAHVINRYETLAKDPEILLNDNVKTLTCQWKRLQIAMVCLAFRQIDNDAVLSRLNAIGDGAAGEWILEDSRLESSLSNRPATDERIFVLLRSWVNDREAQVRDFFKGSKANTLDDFVRSKNITSEEEQKAARLLKEGIASTPRQKIAKRPLEVPQEGESLDSLRGKLEEILNENNQELLRNMAEDVDINAFTNLDYAPARGTGKKPGGRRPSKKKKRNTDFLGYVGEYLIYRALKQRYPHISLSAWVSENKERFYPGSKGNDNLGYDFRFLVDGLDVLIEIKSHTGDQSFFELGTTQLNAAQEALSSEKVFRIWVVRNIDGVMEIDRLPNPMDRKNSKHFRFEIGRVYYNPE